jgi:hypothetical protein
MSDICHGVLSAPDLEESSAEKVLDLYHYVPLKGDIANMFNEDFFEEDMYYDDGI